MILLFWIWSAWVYHLVHVKPMRRAMGEHGIDLCVECGYLLTGLSDADRGCPECGAKAGPPYLKFS